MPSYGKDSNEPIYSRVKHTKEKYTDAVVFKKNKLNVYYQISNKNTCVHIVTEKHFDLYLKLRTVVPSLVILTDTETMIQEKLLEEGFFLN